MRVVVVGGGIAGLAAAHRVTERLPGAEVIVLEQAEWLGGKLRTGTLAGRALEAGAEAFLVRDPHTGGPSTAVRLAEAVGLGGALVHPTNNRAAIAVEGGLRDLPPGTLMGIPKTDLVHDEPADGPLLSPGTDVTVGELVRPRAGDAVVEQYVEPLLGGVYAGRVDQLSLRMAMPALAGAAERARTLADAVGAALAARSGRPGEPVFATVLGGVTRLVRALAERLPDVRTRATVRELHRAGGGWRLTVGPTREPERLDADGVILAVPAKPANRLLSTVDGVPALDLEYASVALIALALPGVKLPELSGFLVPGTAGYAVKAATFFDRKWEHLRRADGVSLVRASVGRAGEESVLQRDDADLVDLVRAELARLLGIDELPAHLDAAVFRWGGALPQYPKNHLDRVTALRAGLARHPAIAVAGAAYDGIGIPACVRSGQAAADLVLADLAGADLEG